MQIGPHLSPEIWNTILEAHGHQPTDYESSKKLRKKITSIFRKVIIIDTNHRLEEKKIPKRLKLQNKYRDKIIVEEN